MRMTEITEMRTDSEDWLGYVLGVVKMVHVLL